MSNLPLNFSIHSFGAWWGAWVAPGATYRKNGRSGEMLFTFRTQAMDLSARSVVR